LKVKTFTEKSLDYWRQFVCGSCKNLVFSRKRNTWVCGRGHSVTKEFCADWIDGIANIRVKMPDGCMMYLAEE
jgi:hypothetical protein